MKIAVVTDDGQTISKHFGRARYYLVFTIEAGAVTEQEKREKPGHQQFAHEDHEVHLHDHAHGMDAHSADKHVHMLDPIRDCAAAVTGGMGTGAYVSLEQAGIRPFLTEFNLVEDAVRAYIDGTLVDHKERLH